jgi:hypothetical protein
MSSLADEAEPLADVDLMGRKRLAGAGHASTVEPRTSR